jgi:hypothetical protein
METLILPSYCSLAPQPQNAIDIFKGQWVSTLPPELGVQAGSRAHFDDRTDPRVSWVNGLYPLEGKSVMELGPYEAFHTYKLSQCGAKPIIAIESNDISYLKCLIVKELLNIQNTSFIYGDFVEHLKQDPIPVDVVWASGVLYHQTDPLMFLDRLILWAKEAIFLWTHYWADGLDDPAFDQTQDCLRTVGGSSVTYHLRVYGQDKIAGFSGGPNTYSYWLSQQDILNMLTQHGFEITMGVDHPNNPAGPAMYLLARRAQPATPE